MCYMLKYIRNFVFGLWYSAMQIMESWLYDPEGKGFGLSDGILPHVDVLTKIKEGPTGLGFGNSCNYENSILITNQEVAEKQGLMEGLSGGFWKTFSNSNGESLSNKVGGGQVSTSASPSFSLKAASGEEETGSKDLSSVIDIDSRDSSLIDLKLGRLCDFRDSKNTKSVEGARNFSSLASPIPAKRIRSTSLNGQTPFCQVRGCNLDLSSSKDYYKRHKVCEVHTKTVQVTVNGIQQRFCQQCSRFHLLAEFDDGKRSCRKRLAGHNERRRKPQIDIHSRRTGRVFQPYHGGRFQGTALSGRSSLVCPDMFPCGLLQDTNWLRHPKSSGGAIGNDMQLHTPVVDGQQVSKSFISFYGMEKQFPSLNGVHTASGNTFSEYGNRYDLGFASPNSVFDNGSTNEVFSGVSDSGCAHSLLSSKSQRSSMFLPAIPIAQPLISQDGNALHSKLPFSDKVSAGSQASTNVTSNSYYLSRLSTVRDGQMGLMVSSANNTVGLEVQTGDIFQGSHFSNAKDPISHEHGQTVDLLQLSSLLQNAEERRLALEVKQEYDPFSSFPIS